MRRLVKDLVTRMTGGRADVADICARAVAGEDADGDSDGGDVCCRVNAAEAALLQDHPGVVALVTPDMDPGEVDVPFVLSGDLLYTRRNWRYEQIVRRRIGKMADEKWFPGVEVPAGGEYAALRQKDQRPAIPKLLERRFSMLTGGPGTGKTFTLGKAVKLLLERAPDAKVALAAPTAKAAACINESLEDLKRDGLLDGVQPATTLHSLLRPKKDFVTFRHDSSNPLPLDWLVVDEASMIDLPMMAKLLDALPPDCALTLIGDAHQLASVEKGRVFGDLCGMFWGNLAALTESARFPQGGTINRLANTVNGEDGFNAAMNILKEGGKAVYRDIVNASAFSPAEWGDFEMVFRNGFRALSQCRTPEEALGCLDAFRILCIFRHGPYGVESINKHVRKSMGRGCPLPVMITQNDSALDVRNGDVGVVMPVGDGEPQYLHLKTLNGTRRVRLELLPATELAFATTIHKSQGSGFGDVAIVLPPDGKNPLLTREALYTGITRTKGSVCIYAGDEAIEACCRRSVERVTGLRS